MDEIVDITTQIDAKLDAIRAYERAMAIDPRFSWPPSNLARVQSEIADDLADLGI